MPTPLPVSSGRHRTDTEPISNRRVLPRDYAQCAPRRARLVLCAVLDDPQLTPEELAKVVASSAAEPSPRQAVERGTSPPSEVEERPSLLRPAGSGVRTHARPCAARGSVGPAPR